MTLLHHERYQPSERSTWLWLGPLLFAGLIGLYFSGRFGAHWAESDSAALSQVFRAFIAGGRLVPNGAVYPNGYAFQSITAAILATTGLDIPTLQQMVYPLLVPLVVLPAWALYRELTGSARGALLATLLLFTQPEFLFVILRSSHEKFTRIFLIMLLYCLVRSFRLRDHFWLFAAHIALTYLMAYAFVASNNLLAHSFIFTVAGAFGISWLALLIRPRLRTLGAHLIHRFVYVVSTCLVLVYLVTFYIYPPAQHDLFALQDTFQRMFVLVLDVQGESTNAYTQVAIGWLSLTVYFIVSLANWLVLLASALIWIYQAFQWFVRNRPVESQISWFLWLLYAAFGLQGALSIVADASGALGSNLQHRLFPSISIVSVALVGATLARWRPPRFADHVGLVLSVGLGCLAVLSMLKATNEPLLSNKWTFYRVPELRALEWTDAHLRNRGIWSEYDERLIVAYETARGLSPNDNRFIGYGPPPSVRSILLTDVARVRARRLDQPLPPPPDAMRVYDNGSAELYHLRPETPYQR
jgi:hypothetical protein